MRVVCLLLLLALPYWACAMSNFEKRDYVGSKLGYSPETVHDVADAHTDTAMGPVQNYQCHPEFIILVARHGTRTATTGVANAQESFANVIKANAKNVKKRWLVRWAENYAKSDQGILTNAGVDEHKFIGKRFFTRYPHLFQLGHVRVQSTEVGRAKDSARSFVKGALGNNVEIKDNECRIKHPFPKENHIFEFKSPFPDGFKKDCSDGKPLPTSHIDLEIPRAKFLDPIMRFFDWVCPKYKVTKHMVKLLPAVSAAKSFSEDALFNEACKISKLIGMPITGVPNCKNTPDQVIEPAKTSEPFKFESEIAKQAINPDLYNQKDEPEKVKGVEKAQESKKPEPPKPHLTLANVKTMWDMCAFARADPYLSRINAKFCDLFHEDYIGPMMEHEANVKDFCMKGPGRHINYKIACPLVSHMYEQILDAQKLLVEQEKVKEKVPLATTAYLLFGHAETLMPLAALLGFGDSWRTSEVAPFAANIAFVLHKCNLKGSEKPEYSYMLEVLKNERSVPLPRKYCSTPYIGQEAPSTHFSSRHLTKSKAKHFCPLSALAGLDQVKKTCSDDFNNLCKFNDKMADVTVKGEVKFAYKDFLDDCKACFSTGATYVRACDNGENPSYSYHDLNKAVPTVPEDGTG